MVLVGRLSALNARFPKFIERQRIEVGQERVDASDLAEVDMEG